MIDESADEAMKTFARNSGKCGKIVLKPTEDLRYIQNANLVDTQPKWEVNGNRGVKDHLEGVEYVTEY